jgi:phi13 family phage major tail protein
MAISGEYKSRIGLDSLYVAAVTEDSATAYTAGTPAYLAPAAEASQEPTTSFEIQYADDQPYDVMTSEGDTKIGLVVTGIDLSTLAAITGRVFDAASGRMWDNGGTAPYYALSFRSLKSNGSYRYYQYLKGKFDMPKEDTATRGEKPEPKTLELTYTAIRTTYKWDLGDVTDSVKRVVGDDDTTNFDETGWFTQVQTPSALAATALALDSSVPTDGATGIAVAANQTLTFNNALLDTAIYNVALLDPSDGSVVAGAISLDATKKIITINPTSSLTVDTAYLIVYNVIDVYGQSLSGAVNFNSVSA